MGITYKDSGVDIDKGDELVSRIKEKVKSTYGNRVHSGVGGFSCLYEISPEKYLAAGTDGVGTKLKIAQQLNEHGTIGIDLVAMCVNDIICTGAEPLFFMDYLACGALDLNASESIIDGVVEGCKQSECALIGGETAEMPGMYREGEYDLAGFAVGEVTKDNLIDGSTINEGDSLVGIFSSGIHSNGFSLVRKLIKEEETDLLRSALTPTKIYVKVLKSLLKNRRDLVKGLAHITGGGFHNIPRMNGNFDYEITEVPGLSDINPIFSEIVTRSGLGHDELYKTFNMGIGMVIATPNPSELQTALMDLGEASLVLGQIRKGEGKLIFSL